MADQGGSTQKGVKEQVVKDFFKRNPKYFSIPDEEPERAIPENLWIKCPKCNELLYTKEFEKNDKVCQKCNYHYRLTAGERISLLLDEGSFTEIDAGLEPADPLNFVSLERQYATQLRNTQKKTNLREAVVSGTGTIEEFPLVIAVCDFSFIGGTMGSVYGEKITRAMELAIKLHIPILTVSASGGARMMEGVFSLMQMAKTAAAVGKLNEAKVPHFSLLTDPCFGGVTASYASLGDIMLAEPGAVIGFTGSRVIEQISKRKVADYRTAEFLLEHGQIDAIVNRRDQRTLFARMLRLYKGVGLPPEPEVQNLTPEGKFTGSSNGANSPRKIQAAEVSEL